jgi:hypothetical protein
MTKKEIIQILMSSPYYLELGLKERRQVFKYLCCLCGEPIGERRKMSAYGEFLEGKIEESSSCKRDIFWETDVKCGR